MAKTARIERYFRRISYLVPLSGLFALFVSGGVGVLVFTGFIIATLFAWLIEDSKWQLSERAAIAIVVLVLAGFFLDWRFGITGIYSTGLFVAPGLARLILVLALIKLLQKKADKDWIYLYLISFFEVLLAAGLSISPLYLVSLFSYLFLTTSAIIAFEIRRSARVEAAPADKRTNTGIRRLAPDEPVADSTPALRLPIVSAIVLLLVVVIGLPIFFTLPRGNAAGFGSDYTDPVSVTGFSDSVTLGTIGRLQQNDAVVMRVRIDQNNNEGLDRFLWRGVALDRFDNIRWTKSNPRYRQPFVKNESNLVLFDYPPRTGQATIQTYYLEPLNTNVLFALRRPFALKGVDIVSRDAEGALLGVKAGTERISYTAYSDTSAPAENRLRQDAAEYPDEALRYLQMPGDMDPRIAQLASDYIREAGAYNRYDIAQAIEERLSTRFKYSLDMKAGGNQPVADFLFNVKSGHCEYFATSMAMMLRTQGIATRVVNGFQSGDFNQTAGVFVVRQQNAHSWVEVYFPETGRWVAFDPTPPDGRPATPNSFFGMITRYIDALETFWIQYVVAYDGQEQRSLFRSVRDGVQGYATSVATYVDSSQQALIGLWNDLRNEPGMVAGAWTAAIGAGLIFLLLILFLAGKGSLRLIGGVEWFRWLRSRFGEREVTQTVTFFDEMNRILEARGIARKSHQTPQEFASKLRIPEAVLITRKYNTVRFGGHRLDDRDTYEIRLLLDKLRSKTDEKAKVSPAPVDPPNS